MKQRSRERLGIPPPLQHTNSFDSLINVLKSLPDDVDESAEDEQSEDAQQPPQQFQQRDLPRSHLRTSMSSKVHASHAPTEQDMQTFSIPSLAGAYPQVCSDHLCFNFREWIDVLCILCNCSKVLSLLYTATTTFNLPWVLMQQRMLTNAISLGASNLHQSIKQYLMVWPPHSSCKVWWELPCMLACLKAKCPGCHYIADTKAKDCVDGTPCTNCVPTPPQGNWKGLDQSCHS